MLRSRVTRQLIVVTMSVAALVACCGVMSFVRTSSGSSVVADGSSPPLVSLAWRIPASRLRTVAFAPGGRFLCTVSRDEIVSLYNTSLGDRVYRTSVQGATAAAVSNDGRYALVYSRLNPANTSLTFLDASGKTCWEMRVDGAVWSADARAVSDGARFAVGTGERYIYIIDIGPRRRHYRRWKTGGAVSSVALAAGANDVAYATWQASTLGRCSVRGARQWETAADRASLHQVDALETSERLLVRVAPNRRGAEGAYVLMDRLGDIISRGLLDSSDDARVMVSPNGQYLCVGASRLIRHRGKSMREKHAVLMDASGKTLCEKGSPFFRANPLIVTSRGYVLLDGGTQLFVMSPSGDLRPAAKTPAPLLRAVPSPDSSKVALICGDGNIHVAKLSEGDKATAALW